MHSCLKHILAAFICGIILLPVAAASEGDVSYELANGRKVSPLESFRECDVCAEMIVMPPGAFMMGAERGESRNPFDFYGENATGRVRGPDEINIIPSEHPRHRVEMDLPYAMARNELTHAEWMACVEDGGCTHTPDHRVLVFRQGDVPLGPDHPVINVSYLDALEYVAWLNGRVGDEVYRLPTEAEWEYAARSGTQTRFAQGDDLTADQANFSRAATEQLRQLPTPVQLPHLTNRRRPVPCMSSTQPTPGDCVTCPAMCASSLSRVGRKSMSGWRVPAPICAWLNPRAIAAAWRKVGHLRARWITRAQRGEPVH
jgi:formylglycine-generating enzyme required for sulfatase activity